MIFSFGSKKESFSPFTPLDFKSVQKKANDFADLIVSKHDELSKILLIYESHEVVEDETERTLDLLRNLDENKEYFKYRVGEVTTFLPRNQVLYAFSCFVVVPALMASEVHFRIPHSMKHFFQQLLDVLEVSKNFPNIHVSSKQRLEFLRDRSAILVNPDTRETRPRTDVVIFTGTSAHADQLRHVFDKNTVFITNGSGHNPLVVSNDADLDEAVQASLTLQLYNQGQDCAAPNSVLVHKDVIDEFLKKLRKSISETRVGKYTDTSARVGPISDPKDLIRVQEFLVDNIEYLDPTTPGVVDTANSVVYPTIINKPLKLGGNFSEVFAPIFFVQEYEADEDLKLYFEDKKYATNAMFITLYGNSKYISNFLEMEFNGKILHDKNSIAHNIHPHTKGFERGTQTYGGYGIGASSISYKGELVSKPTLPQRDIYEYLIAPLVKSKKVSGQQKYYDSFTQIEYKNVEKLLRLSGKKEEKVNAEEDRDVFYYDIQTMNGSNGYQRYLKLDPESLYTTIKTPNIDCISSLTSDDVRRVRALKKLLEKKKEYNFLNFKTEMYAIPKDLNLTDAENKKRQLDFFQKIYRLLFGKDSGPQLAYFLLDSDNEVLFNLLDV
jgi:lysyl-tRNA synthetase class 1